MNDTHGAAGEGWYGFDLDGTLAVYDKWQGIDHIGEPVKPMVDLIRKMHDEGKGVKILTARVAPRLIGETHAEGCRCGRCEEAAGLPPVMQEQYLTRLDDDGTSRKVRASDFITEWCEKHLGFVPEITHEKDHLMLELYDDRVKQVVPNKGILVEDIARRNNLICKEQSKILHDLDRENASLLLKLNSKLNGFSAGFSLALIIVFLVVVGIVIYDSHKQKTSLSEAEKNLDTAIHAYIEAKVK